MKQIKDISFLIFLLIFTLPINSQIHNRKLTWSVDTLYLPIAEKVISYRTLFFENAQFSANQIPYYYELLPTKIKDKIIITNVKYLILNSNELSLLNNTPIYNTQLSYSTNTFKARNNSFVELELFPFIKDSASHNIKKIVSFDIQFSSVEEKQNLIRAKTYVNSSILSSGKWVKIKTKESGIYKISFSDLAEMGFSNPENISLWGSHEGQLPFYLNQPRIDDLKQSAIYLEKGNDGIFNEGDYILFYAKSPDTWTLDLTEQLYEHSKHNYSEFSYYFLSDNQSVNSRISDALEISGNSNLDSYSYNDYLFYEKQDTNLIASGREWFGETFDTYTTRKFDHQIENINLSNPVYLTADFAARSLIYTAFSSYINETFLGRDTINPAQSGYAGIFARSKSIQYEFSPSSSSINIEFNYHKSTSSDKGWLNYYRLNFKRNLNLYKDQIIFRDLNSVQENGITTFHLNGTNENTRVWEISNPYEIANINTSHIAENLSFKSYTDTIKEFIAFNNTNFLSIHDYEQVENQNLHAESVPDYLIVSHEEFLSQAQELAQFHRDNNNYDVLVVSNKQIYNEFSSGTPDVSAIRNFCKYLYDLNPLKFKYLLLFGDGSYDNISSIESGNTNFILTYQTKNSLSPTSSFVSDDYFGLLDDSEGEFSGLLDIGIGRLPAKTIMEANELVAKIKSYNESENIGNWVNDITFIADDEDNNLHISQANSLANQVESAHPEYNLNKIYFDAYPQQTTSAGEKYPDVTQAINDKLKKGTLIFNYTGHGNEKGLAHEKVVTINDILGWNNEKLPLFITATCEFSRFDDTKGTSGGELVLLNPNGGGIALLTTTRLVYSTPNYNLNTSFYKYAFEKNPETNEYNTLGDLIRLTKTDPITGSGSNKRNFTLLGDPGIRIMSPKYTVQTNLINGLNPSTQVDTIRAYDKVTISGEILNLKGEKGVNINGTITPSVYDKKVSTQTLDNDNEGTYSYTAQDNIIFKGNASVKNGSFEFSFIVPKDISYIYDNGKISYFTKIDDSFGNGFSDQVIIGGTNPDGLNDEKGPTIELYLNDENFIEGGYTNEKPKLIAKLNDENGINTTGNGIGHDISAVLDKNIQNSLVLNDYYEAELDSYQDGKVEYFFNNLEEGEHQLKFKAWDIANNSSEEYLSFIVANSENFEIKNLFNYPNPFTENTAFYFEQNQSGQNLEILIQIFTVSGKLIKSIERELNPEASLIGPIHWNGLDDFGDKIGRGVYIYRLKVRSNDKEIEKIEKLVILK